MRSTRAGIQDETKRGRWSRTELARLRELYGLRDDAAIARELRRNVACVLRMARRLFPPVERRGGPWTASEALELKRYLGASSPEVIARILGRTVDEVQAQILDLGRIQDGGSWTREETAQLKRIYGTRTDEDLACVFGRSVDEVRRFSAEHGLSKDKAFARKLRGESATRMPRWNRDKLEVLVKRYPVEPNLQLAKQLGRSVKSVTSKAHKLGLKKSSDHLREMGRTNVRVRYLST